MIRSVGTLLGWLSVTTLAVARPAAKETAVDTTYLRTLAQTRSFQLGRPVHPVPTPDGKAVLFLRSEPRASKLSLFEFDVATGKTRELLTPEQVLKGGTEKLSAEEKAARERMRVSTGGFTTFQLSDDGSLILLSLSGKLYTLERAAKVVRELPTGNGFLMDPKVSPDGKKISYVRDYDVYVFDLAAGYGHNAQANLDVGFARARVEERRCFTIRANRVGDVPDFDAGVIGLLIHNAVAVGRPPVAGESAHFFLGDEFGDAVLDESGPARGNA